MVAVRTCVGTKYQQVVREGTPENVVDGVRMEDAHAVRRVGQRVAICVADGHGSTKLREGVFVGGYESARIACDTAAGVGTAAGDATRVFQRCHAAIRDELAIPGSFWESGVQFIKTQRRPGGELATHGCTLSICQIHPGQVSTFAFVGDSVGVWVTAGGQIVPLGRAHGAKNADEVGRMRAAGTNAKDGYFEFVVGGSTMRAAVSRSIGHFGVPQILTEPDTVHFRAHAGDKILVASDGLWDCMNQTDAGMVLLGSSTEEEAAAALVHACKVRGGGNRDNVTVACHFLEDAVPTTTNTGCCLVQ